MWQGRAACKNSITYHALVVRHAEIVRLGSDLCKIHLQTVFMFKDGRQILQDNGGALQLWASSKDFTRGMALPPPTSTRHTFSGLMLQSTPIWWSEEGDSGSLVTGTHPATINAWRRGAFRRGSKIKRSVCMRKILGGWRFGVQG